MSDENMVMPRWERPVRIPEKAPLTHADPPCAIAGEPGTWRLPFMIPEDIAGGERLCLLASCKRNSAEAFENLSVKGPREPGAITAFINQDQPIELRQAAPGSFEFSLPARGVKRGETIVFVIHRAVAESRMLDKFFALHKPPQGTAMRLAPPTLDLVVSACSMHVLGGPATHIHAWARAWADADGEISILVRPEDKFHNLSAWPLKRAAAFLDGRELECVCEPVPNSSCLILKTKPAARGVTGITVRLPETGLVAETNPIMGPAALPELRPFWGMIHGHTEMSDGYGSLNNYFHQLRHEAALDFGAPGDHDHLNETTDEMWKLTCERVRQWNAPGSFVTFLGYEWAKWRRNGDGDRNVYYLEDDKPLFRSDEGEYPTPPDLFRALRGENAIVIPHHTAHSGNFCDFKDHDPALERLIEIYQERGSYECAEQDGNPIPEHFPRPPFEPYPNPPYPGGFIRDALALGWRAGFTAGGDDHTHSAGTGRRRDGLMCVFAGELTRHGLWEGMRERRVTATTGARILLFYSVNGKPMGCEHDARKAPGLLDARTMQIEFHGTARARKLEIIRNNRCVHEETNRSTDFTMEWTDTEPLAGALMPPAKFCKRPFCFYYIRVRQEDGEMAWASPVWIDG